MKSSHAVIILNIKRLNSPHYKVGSEFLTVKGSNVMFIELIKTGSKRNIPNAEEKGKKMPGKCKPKGRTPGYPYSSGTRWNLRWKALSRIKSNILTRKDTVSKEDLTVISVQTLPPKQLNVSLYLKQKGFKFSEYSIKTTALQEGVHTPLPRQAVPPQFIERLRRIEDNRRLT